MVSDVSGPRHRSCDDGPGKYRLVDAASEAFKKTQRGALPTHLMSSRIMPCWKAQVSVRRNKGTLQQKGVWTGRIIALWTVSDQRQDTSQDR